MRHRIFEYHMELDFVRHMNNVQLIKTENLFPANKLYIYSYIFQQSLMISFYLKIFTNE